MVAMVLGLSMCATAFAAVVQEGNLRISIATRLSPYKLPRTTSAPIKAFIAGHVFTADGSTPPQLKRMDIEINRHGHIETEGLPVCRLSQIKATSTERAIAACGESLVGAGHFWASVVLPEQGVYHTTGRLLAFNGLSHGRPAVLAQIYTTQPFPSSFVVPFAITHLAKGRYGTKLSAELPEALGEWGFVDRIKMTIGRTPREGRGYLDASCPAPRGTDTASFPLALADFAFAGGQALHATVTKSCGVVRHER